ncbi:MAG: hypothetical protein SFU53_01815 [Terrimicrobiaceae bacterium]|nr:hypothetical protein [Terrimicrobiaceae bacterium]
MKTRASTLSGPVRRANPLILSLDNPADVLRSAGAPGRVYWTSLRPPEQSAGDLIADVSEFEGAWLDSKRVIVQIDGRRIEHELGDSCTPDLMTEILRSHLAGDPPNRIQSGLHSAAGI